MGFLGGHNQWDSVELFKTLRHAAKWYSQTFKSEQGETVVDLQKAFAVADAFGKQTGRADDELRLGWGGRVADVLVDMLVYFNKQIMPDEDPEKMAAHAVKVRCDELLTAMPTTPDADLEWLEKMSKDGDATGDATEKARMERKKLAVEYRLRKKGLLMHFIEG